MASPNGEDELRRLQADNDALRAELAELRSTHKHQ